MRLNRREFLKRTGAGAALITAGSGLVKSSAFAMNPTKFQAKSDVSFVGSSSTGTRRQMIIDVLAPWKDTVAAGIAGKTILIKPNMVYWGQGVSQDPTLALTHIDAVRGLIDFLRSISATVPIIIGDIPAVNPNIMTILTNAGYNVLTTEYTGISLVDLGDTAKFPAVNCNIWTPSLSTATLATVPVCSVYTNPQYYVISITRPKTHNCMTMTGVNKNILMGAPLLTTPSKVHNKSVDTKNFMHGQDGWSTGQNPGEIKCLAYNLYQLANVIYPTGAPALAVLDAWEGMEGDGPVSGTSVMQYCAVAGIDPLAVDRLSAKLMGFSDTAIDPMNKATPSYTDMRALMWISNAGFGNYDLSKINFKLGSLSELTPYVKQYKLHSNYTGVASYETNWTGGAPPTVLAASSVRDSRSLDPKPFLVAQIREEIRANEIAVHFSLPISERISLGIVNMQGVEIRRLGSEFLTSGRYTIPWNRRDNAGARVPAGRYVIKLGFGSRSLCDPISLVD